MIESISFLSSASPPTLNHHLSSSACHRATDPLTCPSRRRSARNPGRAAETAEGEMTVVEDRGSAIECSPFLVVVIASPASPPPPPLLRWRLTAARRLAAAEASIVAKKEREVEVRVVRTRRRRENEEEK